MPEEFLLIAKNIALWPINKIKEYKTVQRQNQDASGWITDHYNKRTKLLGKNYLDALQIGEDYSSKLVGKAVNKDILRRLNTVPVTFFKNTDTLPEELSNAKGVYLTKENKIYISPNADETTELHEKTHAIWPNAAEKLIGNYLQLNLYEKNLNNSTLPFWQQGDADYYNEPGEIYARRNLLWKEMGWAHNYKLTDKDIIENANLFNKYHLNYSKDFLKYLFNDIAQNINTQSTLQNVDYAKQGGKMNYLEYFKKGGIYIKPENRGKFTETKKRTGKTTEELTHSKNPITRKRAIFAQNVKKWDHAKKHAKGGALNYLTYFI